MFQQRPGRLARSTEVVEAARLFWRIARQIEPEAIASGLLRNDSLRVALSRLHEHFTDQLECLAAAFVHPIPVFATAGPGATTTPATAGDDGTGANVPAASDAGGSGDADKDRRVRGDLWFELTDDGARVKRAYIASGKKTGAVTFGDQLVQRAVEQLFIRAAADGSFTREDVRDVLDEFRMSDASQDKVRDELDYAICRAIGAVGKGRGKPKAFTLANKRYTSDIRFRCLNGEDAEARQNRQAAVDAYAQSVGRKGDRRKALHCFNEDGDEVEPPAYAGVDGGADRGDRDDD